MGRAIELLWGFCCVAHLWGWIEYGAFIVANVDVDNIVSGKSVKNHRKKREKSRWWYWNYVVDLYNWLYVMPEYDPNPIAAEDSYY